MGAYVNKNLSRQSHNDLKAKFEKSNIPEDPTVSREQVMQTIAMIKDKQVVSSRSCYDKATQKALRDSMIAHSYKLGSIIPEHNRLSLVGRPRQSLEARDSSSSPLPRTTLVKNAQTIVASAQQSNISLSQANSKSDLMTVNQQKFRWI